MNIKRTGKSKDIAIIAISGALIIVLQAIAEGLKFFGLPLSFALGLIPVLVVAQLRGWRTGAILGTVFGLASFVIGIIQFGGFAGLEAIAFNPLVTVLPRTIVGIVVGLVAGAIAHNDAKRLTANYEAKIPEKEDIAREKSDKAKTRKKAFARFGKGYIRSALATLAGVLTNTIGFLSMFYIFGNGKTIGGAVINITYILMAIVAVNTIVEIVAFVVIVPAIVQALTKSKLLLDREQLDLGSATNRAIAQRATKDHVSQKISVLVLSAALLIALIVGLAVCLAK